MKKILFALLATVAISPAMAQTYNSNGYRTTPRPQPVYRTTRPTQQQTRQMREPAVYRTNEPVQYQTYQTNQQPTYKKAETSSKYALGNPMYRPGKNKGVVAGSVSYSRIPKNDAIAQRSESFWEVVPSFEFGLTDKLVLNATVGYERNEIKSKPKKGAKINSYYAEVGASYQILSIEGVDFNAGLSAYYEMYKDKKEAKYAIKNGRISGTDLAFQIGKKIENVTPYFKVGFLSDFWSKRGCSNGTNTYINPGIYIDINEQFGLNLDYTSVVHADSTYRAVLDFYPQDNISLGFGLFMSHPETDGDIYGGLANFKFGF